MYTNHTPTYLVILLILILSGLCVSLSSQSQNTSIAPYEQLEIGDTSIVSLKLPPKGADDKLLLPKSVKFRSTKEALSIARNVIKHKKSNLYTSEAYCNYDVYDKLMLACYNFDPENKYMRRWPFLKIYSDTTLVGRKSILPFAMYEAYTSNFHRKENNLFKQIVRGRHIYGITDELHAEDLCEDLIRTLENVDIRNNDFRIYFNKIISPLNDTYGTNFYRWQIMDTVQIEGKPYTVLAFRPSSLLELGFTGNIYVSTDGNYSIKKSVMKISRAMDLNFIEEFLISREYLELPTKIWIPTKTSVISKVSFYGIIKNWVEFGRSYDNFQFSPAPDSVYKMDKRIAFDKGYLRKENSFWESKRVLPFTVKSNEYITDSIVKHVTRIPTIKYSTAAFNFLTTSYFPLSKDPMKNKLNIGSFDTFYSMNTIEGSRLRLSTFTTANLHPHLFLSGYGAYGFKDEKFKYSMETIWAFNKPLLYPKEFPQNNLSFTYEYDLNALGENNLYVKKNNILLSLLRNRNLQRMTYARRYQLTYIKEYLNGLSFQLLFKSQEERPAGTFMFEKYNAEGMQTRVNQMQTSEITTIMRFASKERFLLRNYERKELPGERFVVSLTNTIGLKDFLDGEYGYYRAQLHIIKDFWLASFGQLKSSFKLEKVWGTLPYPLLLSPNANNSYTLQNETFYLIHPLEFINDRQFCWDIDYNMRGWLFRQIPLIKRLRLREVIGISGFCGKLSPKNLPENSHNLLIYLPDSRLMEPGKPYIEANLGLGNILRILRFDYIRRLTYLQGNVKRSGFRVSAQLRF